MATGVPPRDDDFQFSKIDMENIQDAMKSKKFRDMFVDYCNEVRDPANQALYQKEMTQLEKERGYDITFINPVEGYVIKTSVAGDRKAFINICSNANVGKPDCNVDRVNGQRGLNWRIPYSLIAPREDFDKKRQRCVIYDVVFHPDTLRIAAQNKQFRELVNKTAFDALKTNYNVNLDRNNFKCPKSTYKGMVTPAVIRTEDPHYEPPSNEDEETLPAEVLEKLYPQKSYGSQRKTNADADNGGGDIKSVTNKGDVENKNNKTTPLHRKRVKNSNEYIMSTENGYTIPKYVIKQQKNVDLQDFTYHKECKLNSAIPSQIVVEVNLPLLSSTSDCILDVQEKSLSLKSETPAKYKLNMTLPYPVCETSGNAKFDKTKRILIVTLPVIKNSNVVKNDALKVDSGVESADNSESNSDDEAPKNHFIEELPPIPEKPKEELSVCEEAPTDPNPSETFFSPSLGYVLPTYTHNVLDDTIAFTFHVKNTEPDSVKVLKIGSKVFIKFTSVGAGFVPTHYGALIILDKEFSFDNVTGEAWDNNVILQLEFSDKMPTKFEIGLNEDCLTSEQFDLPITASSDKDQDKLSNATTTVEILNMGSETNIVLSSSDNENGSNDSYDNSDDTNDHDSYREKEIIVIETEHNSNAKSILRKSLGRSISESSYGDVASSMDYVSSDCIPESGTLEESSFKKTVRFSDVIARQFYRYMPNLHYTDGFSFY